MEIEIKKPFSSNSGVDGFDVLVIKRALNKLGYYYPHGSVGITNVPDHRIFQAVQEFQKDHQISVSGAIRPGDRTTEKINQEVLRIAEGQYIWRTASDEKVRESHKGV